MDDKLLTVSEVAERVGVSETLVRSWVTTGEIAHHRLGRRKRGAIRIGEADLEAFVRRRRHGEREETRPAPLVTVKPRHLKL
jgi:excisionase family DNA binding protein